MRTLRLGLRGDDVRAWKAYLLGRQPSCGIVIDDCFDDAAFAATKAFQREVGFTRGHVDGIVGPMTLGQALIRGFDPLDDDDKERSGPGWPPRPDSGPLGPQERSALFGTFQYRPSPVTGNPEAIEITDGWAAKNITTVRVPQLVGLAGRDGSVRVNAAVAGQLIRTFDAWQRLGLADRVLAWGGCWVPRFIRGSRTALSNHAWGTAFDINVRWNRLGSRPALVGETGCVRELVESAYENGFYWGGWFKGGRVDGMHFEAWKRA